MMIPRRFFVGFLGLSLLVLFLAGCSKSGEDIKGSGTREAATASKESGSADATGSDEKKGPGLSSVPPSLKHDGYAYYGLEHEKPIEYEVISTALPSADTGNATTTLSEVKGETARFITSRTGTALSAMGDEEIEVRPDGVYNTKIGGQPVNPAQLVLPAELPPGKSWSTKGTVTAQTATGMKTFDQNFTYKVVGTEKVKTKAGEFEALKVTATGQIKVDGKTSQSEVAAWYVKGVGTVKMAITTSGVQKGTMTIEATKIP